MAIILNWIKVDDMFSNIPSQLMSVDKRDVECGLAFSIYQRDRGCICIDYHLKASLNASSHRYYDESWHYFKFGRRYAKLPSATSRDQSCCSGEGILAGKGLQGSRVPD